ncbi:MAG: hypothetical protein EBY16_02705 [Gammaproteobacteria bacterium]|nr:hypothetical protein [Gammaproteobacteria bacterium]
MKYIVHPYHSEKLLRCPCGTGKTYMNCCGVFISNQNTPATPEELMRSRYTAYVQVNVNYIAQTMKSPAADSFDADDLRMWSKKAQWMGLDVIKTRQELNKGIVEFRAYYCINGKKSILHEISEFNFENGQWYYVNGSQT